MNAFGLWEEAACPGENPRVHGGKHANSTQNKPSPCVLLNPGHSVCYLTFILKGDYARETPQHSLKEANYTYLFIPLLLSTINFKHTILPSSLIGKYGF